MYIHKYKKDTGIIYKITSGSAKPSETITLKVSDWTGRIAGTSKIETALGMIESAFREKPEEPEEGKKLEKKEKKAIAEKIRKFALMINKE